MMITETGIGSVDFRVCLLSGNCPCIKMKSSCSVHVPIIYTTLLTEELSTSLHPMRHQ